MSTQENISVLVLSNYMICPPISGGAKRVLFPAMNFSHDDGVDFSFLFLSFSEDEISFNQQFLQALPTVKEAHGVLTTEEFQYDWKNIPKNFSDQVWYTLNENYLQAVCEHIRSTNYDIIQVIHTQFAWIVPFLRKHSDAKIVLDQQNVEWMVYKRWLPYAKKNDYDRVNNDYITLKSWEDTVLSWFDHILCISPEEVETVRQMAPKPDVIYAPSGAAIDDRSYHPQSHENEKPYDLFFIGSMNWYPNAHGLIWLIDEVFPIILKKRPNTKLEIVGSGKPDDEMLMRIARHKGITFWGSIEDERPLFHQSKVFVSPVWIGAGVRLKNPTAWAAKLPVVATSLSAEGLLYTDKKDILIGDNPEDFAAHVLSLLDSPLLREQIADEAYSTYVKHYSRDNLVEMWKAIYQRISGRG